VVRQRLLRDFFSAFENAEPTLRADAIDEYRELTLLAHAWERGALMPGVRAGMCGPHSASSQIPNYAAGSLERPGPLGNGWSGAPCQSLQEGLMPESDKVFAGSIPKFYDTLMVPLIFEAYAAHMAELVAASSPSSVLETAAGSGVVTRALATRLSADARYMVTDLNQPMLEYAAARQGPDSRIEWRLADALDLPFEDASFDVVCCQFGAMFFPNRVAGYIEARRVLRPGGRFVFSVWDRIEENAFADDVTKAVAALFPHDPPRFLARTPHGYHDIELIREELSRAGFADIDFKTRQEVSRARSARDAATAYCQGTPLRNEIETRDSSLLQIATDRATEAIASRHGKGPVTGKIQAHVIVAAG
jgi:ubiquinone/menaquinone biosynthesis C-methylase UbiE